MGQGWPGDLREADLGCRMLVWDPEGCGLVLPSLQMYPLIRREARISLGMRSNCCMLGELPACAGIIPTAKQNLLLARLRLTTSDGTNVILGEGHPRGCL